MNYSSFIVKIIGKPEQSFFDNNISVTEVRVRFYPLRETGSDNLLQISAWGNLAYDLIQYYKENDLIIIEGYISLRKPILSELNSPKDKRAEISVFKIYPFLLKTQKLTQVK